MPPAPLPRSHTGATTSGVVFNAPASKSTQTTLGITRWHAILEQKSGSVVIDGSDPKGKVCLCTHY